MDQLCLVVPVFPGKTADATDFMQEMSSYLSGPSAEPAPRGQLGPPQQVLASPGADSQALVHPETVNREANAQPLAERSRGLAAFHAIAPRLRRYLADSARYWALAAGVPPDLYD